MKQYTVNDNYRDIASEVIAEHEDLHWIETSGILIDYLSSDEEKHSAGKDVYGECIRVKEVYKPYCPYDFLIVLYEPNIIHLTDDQLKILIHHELLHIGIDEKDGNVKYVINPHDIEDFRSIIDEYGLDWAR